MTRFRPKWLALFLKRDHGWFRVLATIALVFVLVVLYSYAQQQSTEGFTSTSTSMLTLDETYSLKQGTDEIFDDFYAELSDQLIPAELCIKEVDAIVQSTQSSPETSVLLDIGSQRGQLLQEFKNRGYGNIYGMDLHKAMIQHTFQEIAGNVVCADPLDRMNFDRATFSHVLCLHQTLYELADLSSFFQNVRFWLKLGGVLVLHLVQYEKKSQPVTLSATPRIQYVRQVEIFDQSMVIQETFTDKSTHHVRQQEQVWGYQNLDRVINTAVYYGFTIQGKIQIKCPTVPVNTREYLYFLTV